ncbi:hypothetical protein Bca4012_053043 [Brassica carinata]
MVKAHNKAILIWTSPKEIIKTPSLVVVAISSGTRLRFDQNLKFRTPPLIDAFIGIFHIRRRSNLKYGI